MKATASATEQEQRAALAAARRRATGLLGVVAVGFVATFALEDSTAVGYLRAALEAGLVGGLADWFAVVALFRHPLGLPIPKTAVIPKSKDGLGANLAVFIEENFLDPEQVRERLADPVHVERLGNWLARPANAERIAAQAAEVAAAALDAADESAVVRRISHGIRTRLPIPSLAGLAGSSLAEAVRDGRHEALVTSTVDAIHEQIEQNRAPLRRRLGEQSPSWVPAVLDDLVFERAEHVVRTFLTQVARDTDHEIRHAADAQLLELARRLQHDDALVERVEEVIGDILTEDRLDEWVTAWWREVRERVRRAGGPDGADSELRRLAAEALGGVGERLSHGGPLHDRVVEVLADIAPQVAAVGQREVGNLVGATIDRWDAEETSDRLELWMGRDLQFVRINGTVVGAVVGIVLHALASGLA